MPARVRNRAAETAAALAVSCRTISHTLIRPATGFHRPIRGTAAKMTTLLSWADHMPRSLHNLNGASIRASSCADSYPNWYWQQLVPRLAELLRLGRQAP